MLKRLRISFEADFDFDCALELRIIEFLKLLKYGMILSNQQTRNFSEAIENCSCWKLNDE